ncbi:1-acyl-sn-glycerol-3-phosphate acyltransferase [Leptospira fletcheri]|uniref:1-acyl-sn-glycerol-3-phosphate acyltransferase n=1 Tax=Leptospira fletcheri TaxID=2484981 RepID=A0A4R9GKN1_9LEPT|nr:lysophospholipid acyltransferase family protein [Leptospira fletcheri]TGK13081.1 1-acyl-sn-glycerol-3-phosphate acyltransferase [Leptospira fletcheri]
MNESAPRPGELESLFLIPREYARIFLKGLMNLIYDVEVQGVENVPESSGGVIVSNHTDNLDVIVQGTAVSRKIVYLGKYELFHPQEPFLELLKDPSFEHFPLSLVKAGLKTTFDAIGGYQGKTLLNWGGVPILRSHNITDSKSAAKYYEDLENYMVDLVQKGELISVYPEGTRSEDGKLGSFKALAAKIAIRAGVPIIPSGIHGAWRMTKLDSFLTGKVFKTKIVYKIGRPIFPAEFPNEPLKRSAKLLTEELERRVAELSGADLPNSQEDSSNGNRNL